MNRCLVLAAAMAAAGMLSACAALQQAPLLYASKSTVGLDVSTSTTETPGGSISIGVKIVDYAYVPVAVSKVRDRPGQGDVHEDIVPIVAAYGEGATAAGLDALSDDNKRKLQEYLDAKANDQKLLDVLKEQQTRRQVIESDLVAGKAQVERYKRDIAELELVESKRAQEATAAAAAASAPVAGAPTAPPAPAVPSTSTPPAAMSTARTAQQMAERTLRTREDQLVKVDADIKTTKDTLAERKLVTDRLFKAAAEAVSVLRTDKTDAMSVYGRFNTQADVPAGSASSPSPSAGLTAGKIFSTGVASQNLTEAVRQEAALVGLAKCVDSVARAASGVSAGAERDAVLRSMASICSVRGTSNGRTAGG